MKVRATFSYAFEKWTFKTSDNDNHTNLLLFFFQLLFQGVFGFVILGILLCPMYYIHVPGNFSTNPENRLEDIVDAFVQLGNSWELDVATVGKYSLKFYYI